MDLDEMNEYEMTVSFASGDGLTRPSREKFLELLASIGRTDRFWLVVARVPAVEGDFMQVLREAEHAYRVEKIGEGGDETRLAVLVDSPEAVDRILASWLRRDGEWAAAHAWVRHGELDSAVEPAVEVGGEAAEMATRLVAEGYLELDEIAEDLEGYFNDGQDELVLSYVQAEDIAHVAWQARRAEQETWPNGAATDPDLIEEAFEELEDRGIVARENFACCANCGHAEIGAELEEDSRGFVFFHNQSTERAVRSGELYLYHGARRASDAAEVAREIVDVLSEQGLSVGWNGDPGKAIVVAPIAWHKWIAAPDRKREIPARP